MRGERYRIVFLLAWGTGERLAKGQQKENELV